MTNQQHPLTPPPELVQEWIKECDKPNNPRWQEYEQDIATRAAQWGADQELEACCEWAQGYAECGDSLRIARRPKPPSLAEEALATLHGMRIEPCIINGVNLNADLQASYNTIHRALERLQQLEEQQ